MHSICDVVEYECSSQWVQWCGVVKNDGCYFFHLDEWMRYFLLSPFDTFVFVMRGLVREASEI